jgi:hypothetical protein
MGEVAQSFPKAFAVTFSALKRWDPNSFHDIKWHWPFSVMAPVSSVLRSRKEKVDRNANGFADLMPVTIHFDGSIEPRKINEDKEYTMELFWARPGDVVASKIDLKNGAVAILPDDWEKAVVTNHFAIYEPDLNRLDPNYFHLLIQAKFFKEHLWRNKVGAEGRKEVKLDFFESLEIPIPSLPVQQKIVGHWQSAKKERSSADLALSDLVSELNSYLVKQTHAFKQVTRSRVLLATYENTQQWDLKAGRAAAFMSANPGFIRLGDYTEECAETVRPWEDAEKEWPVYGVNNKEGVFLSSMQLGSDFNAPYKKIEKDWFFHNPTRANVGSLGIVQQVPEDAITSPEYQVWRLKGGFLPDFMALMLKTDYFLALVAFNRVGGVKQRMYYANLAEIRLPEIPENVQRDFARRRLEILANINAANGKLAQRKQEIEQMILGIRPVKAQ